MILQIPQRQSFPLRTRENPRRQDYVPLDALHIAKLAPVSCVDWDLPGVVGRLVVLQQGPGFGEGGLTDHPLALPSNLYVRIVG